MSEMHNKVAAGSRTRTVESPRARGALWSALRGTSFVATDFDGCVAGWNVDYRSDPRVKELAELVAGRGDRYEFAIISGGRVGRLRNFVDMVGAPLFAENGGVLYDPSNGEIRILADKEKIAPLMTEVIPRVDRFIESRFPGSKKSEKLTMATYYRPKNVPIGTFESAVRELIESMPMELRLLVGTTFSESSIDVTFMGSNKAVAISHITELYGLDGRKIAYIGDGSNDIPAFDLVLAIGGITIMPKNSDLLVRQYAKQWSNSSRAIVHELEATECVIDVVKSLGRS